MSAHDSSRNYPGAPADSARTASAPEGTAAAAFDSYPESDRTARVRLVGIDAGDTCDISVELLGNASDTAYLVSELVLATCEGIGGQSAASQLEFLRGLAGYVIYRIAEGTASDLEEDQ